MRVEEEARRAGQGKAGQGRARQGPSLHQVDRRTARGLRLAAQQ